MGSAYKAMVGGSWGVTVVHSVHVLSAEFGTFQMRESLGWTGRCGNLNGRMIGSNSHHAMLSWVHQTSDG